MQHTYDMVANLLMTPVVVDPADGVLRDAAAHLVSALDRVGVEGWQSVHPEAAADLAGVLMRVASRLQAHAAAASRRAQSGDVARRRGFTSPGAMLGASLGGDQGAGAAVANVGRSVQAGSRTDKSMLAGEVSLRHARVIGDALAHLPASVTDEQRAACERALIIDAQKLSPTELVKRARRIIEVYAPKPVVDATEDELLAAREAKARAAMSFQMWDQRDGTWGFRGVLPEVEAAMLKAAVEGYAAPRRAHLEACAELSLDDSATDVVGHRLGVAFGELVSHLDPSSLPQHGGLNARVMVTMTLDSLRDGLRQAGSIVGGERISAATARRLACTADIIPAVLGGGSVPLDLGRTSRLFSPAQRTAIAIRDNGCTYPGCSRPPSWCEVHHFTNGGWAGGGETNVNDGAMLCALHHHHVEAERIPARLGRDDRVEYQLNGHWRHNHRWRPPDR